MAYLVEINAMCLNLLCFLCSPKQKILWPERSDSDTRCGSLWIAEQFAPRALEMPAFAENTRKKPINTLANDQEKRTLSGVRRGFGII